VVLGGSSGRNGDMVDLVDALNQALVSPPHLNYREGVMPDVFRMWLQSVYLWNATPNVTKPPAARSRRATRCNSLGGVAEKAKAKCTPTCPKSRAHGR